MGADACPTSTLLGEYSGYRWLSGWEEAVLLVKLAPRTMSFSPSVHGHP